LSCLHAVDVVTIFVVNVDTIEVLFFYNIDKARGDLIPLAKAVVPAVMLITCIKEWSS
jgi:hypothetical protein